MQKFSTRCYYFSSPFPCFFFRSQTNCIFKIPPMTFWHVTATILLVFQFKVMHNCLSNRGWHSRFLFWTLVFLIFFFIFIFCLSHFFAIFLFLMEYFEVSKLNYRSWKSFTRIWLVRIKRNWANASMMVGSILRILKMIGLLFLQWW